MGTKTEKQRQEAREYYQRNRERIRAQQKEFRLTEAGRQGNKRCSDSWYRAAARRGVVLWRLKPPRSIAAAAARLRWRMTLQSSNASESVGSVWESMALFGDGSAIRFRDRRADVESSTGTRCDLVTSAGSEQVGKLSLSRRQRGAHGCAPFLPKLWDGATANPL